MEVGNIQWGEFMFIDIFTIKNGFYNKKPNPSNGGTIPFIGATQNNNGVTEFYTLNDIENNSKTGHGKNEQLNKKLFRGNCIAVTNNGSVGFAYYQIHDFTCSHDVNLLYLKKYILSPYIAKFLISTIEMQRVCFEYARKWRPKRMVKSKILLPMDSKGEPDYAFMELYMRHKEQDKVKIFQKYIAERILKVKDFKAVDPLDKKKWGGFFIDDIFNIKSGKRLTKADMIKGTIPFIGASDSNNGITNFVSNSNSSLDSNVLGVNYNGSVVENFYHPYKAIFSDDVKRLSLKQVKGNEFLFLFIKTIILKQKSKYQYAYKFNETRMLRQKLLFPIDKNGQIDYTYMENYVKKLEYEKLTNYIEVKKRFNQDQKDHSFL